MLFRSGDVRIYAPPVDRCAKSVLPERYGMNECQRYFVRDATRTKIFHALAALSQKLWRIVSTKFLFRVFLQLVP